MPGGRGAAAIEKFHARMEAHALEEFTLQFPRILNCDCGENQDANAVTLMPQPTTNSAKDDAVVGNVMSLSREAKRPNTMLILLLDKKCSVLRTPEW